MIGVSSERDVDRANQWLIPRDAGEHAVLSVGSKLLRDGDVLAGQHDAHTDRQASFEPAILWRQLVLLHLAPERDGTNVEGLGGLLPVAFVALECSLNQVTLLGAEVQRITGHGASLAL